MGSAAARLYANLDQQQFKEQAFVNEEMDGAHFGGMVYQTVFSDCW